MTDKNQAAREFEQILRERRVRTLFQPIVPLASGVTVGYEALVRGPKDSRFASASALLEAAYLSDTVAEFDWVARASACRAAMAADLRPDQLLFMNVEPLALDSDCPRDQWPDIEKAFGLYQVVLEVTERSLDRDPGTLLDGIDRLRGMVAGLALDDVGSDATTVSMLPIVAPAVIKLDLEVTQAGLSPEVAQVLDVVYEESERTGATILCEGIETAAHHDKGRSLGALLGQGNYLGMPQPLEEQPRQLGGRVTLRAETLPAVATPFDALDGQVTGRASADLLLSLSQRLGSCGVDLPLPALHITHLPHPDLFSPSERDRLGKLAGRGVMTAVLGPGVPTEPGDGIRGVGMRREPELRGEWAVVALGPCSVGAMLARAVEHKSGQEDEYEFGITHDKQRVIAAARCLLRRLGAPEPHFDFSRHH